MRITHAFLAIAAVLILNGPPARTESADSISCDTPFVIETVKRIVKGMNWPLGGGPINVLKFYNYHPNPDLSGAPMLLTDTKSPCKVNLITDRGEFGFTYGWKRIEGETFIMGQIGMPDE